MRLIVADAAGAGWLRDKDGNDHQLAADSWAECDVRDTIFTGEGETAWVRYREDGRQVDVQPNSEYHIEYQNDDVIDVRAASPAVDELVAATEGIGTDEERIYRALATVQGNAEAIEQVRALFLDRTGRTLDEVLDDELSGSELDRAMAYLR
jgi:Annexin